MINFSLEDGILSIETETAWGEMDEVRHSLLHELWARSYKPLKI